MSRAGDRSGRFVVLAMYVAITLLSGFLGVLVAVFGPADLQPVRLFGLVTLQPTPLGLAIYGAVTVAVVLGVPLVAVVALSRRRNVGGHD